MAFLGLLQTFLNRFLAKKLHHRCVTWSYIYAQHFAVPWHNKLLEVNNAIVKVTLQVFSTWIFWALSNLMHKCLTNLLLEGRRKNGSWIGDVKSTIKKTLNCRANHRKSMDWFLCDRDHHKRVKGTLMEIWKSPDMF